MDETDDMTPEQVAELQKQNCIFCKIASKEIPSKILHETDKVICVLDINPATEGHLIIFPKEHYMILPHIPREVNNELFRIVKLISKTLLKTLKSKGTSIFIANGMAAGQKAPHVLIHLFPRREGDGLLNLEGKNISEEKMKGIISQIKPYMSQVLGDQPLQVKDDAKNVKSKKIVIDKEEPKEAEEKPKGKREERGDNNDESKEIIEESEDVEEEKIKVQKKNPQKNLPKEQQKKDVEKKKTDLDAISRLFT